MRIVAPLTAALVVAAGCKSNGASQVRELDPGQNSEMAPTDSEVMGVDAMIARAMDPTKRDYWPDQTTDWRWAPKEKRRALVNSQACQDFIKFTFPNPVNDENLPEKEQTLKTDGLIVIKNGRILYERYTGPYAEGIGADSNGGNFEETQGSPKLHCMWSASKSFTAGILGAVVQQSEELADGSPTQLGRFAEGGRPVTLRTKLRELISAKDLGLEDERRRAALSDQLEVENNKVMNLTLEHFAGMSPNLDWREKYTEDISISNIVGMLWVNGFDDMAKYAASQKFAPQGPGNGFIYSSGNALIVMRALKAIYGERYSRMPWDVLFDRIGMKRVAFEQDQSGVFVGSSYVHTTLRDMAKFGYVYLNGGVYKGEQVIHKEFIEKARQLSLGMRAPGTTEAVIEEEEGFYGLGFYYNADPADLRGEREFSPTFRKERFFPNVTKDAFMAAGHYGQNILIFPKDDLLVVRMSHDKEYWSRLDEMMSKARACWNAELN